MLIKKGNDILNKTIFLKERFKMADKKKVNFKKLKIEGLVELYKEVGEEKIAAKKFDMSKYVEEKAEKSALVDIVNADGKPKYYVGKDGKTKIKKKRVAVGDKKVKKFNLMAAKRDFYDAFKEEYDWEDAPRAKQSGNKSDVAKNALASIGIKL